RGADVYGLVGSRDVQSLAIGIRIDRYSRDPEPTRRPHDAAGDLPAIGYQDLLQHGRIHTPHGRFHAAGNLATSMCRTFPRRVQVGRCTYHLPGSSEPYCAEATGESAKAP